jgi:hypothetical protein
MVINNFNLLGMAIGPNKANTPLVVDADAVLPSSVATQSFQPVAGRYTQKVKTRRGMYLLQFPNSHGCNVRKPCHPSPVKQQFGVRVAEALNHADIVTSFGINVKCYVLINSITSPVNRRLRLGFHVANKFTAAANSVERSHIFTMILIAIEAINTPARVIFDCYLACFSVFLLKKVYFTSNFFSFFSTATFFRFT